MSLLKSCQSVIRWPLPLLAIWLLFPLVGLVLRLTFSPIQPHDYWWALTMGRLIAVTGEVPDANLFLHTFESGVPFFDQPWLAQWMLYVLFDSIGHEGLALFRVLVALLTWIGVMAIALSRSDDARVVGGLALLGIATTAMVFSVRTQLFAFLPFVALLAALVQLADGKMSGLRALVLVPVVAYWANVHGTFILAPILASVVGAGVVLDQWLAHGREAVREARTWTLVVAAAAIAPIANPRGVGLYGYVVNLVFTSDVSDSVSEWQAPGFDSGVGAMIVISVLAGFVVLIARHRSVRAWEALLYGAVALLALGSMRSVIWWGAVMVAVVAPHAAALVGGEQKGGVAQTEGHGERSTTPAQGVIHLAIALVLIGVTVAVQPPGALFHTIAAEFNPGARRQGIGKGVLDAMNPVDLVQLLDERGHPGHIYHSQEIGGLLEFELTDAANPRQVAFVDQRMELIPAEIWEDYFIVAEARPAWEERLAAYGVQTVIASLGAQPRLVQALERSPDWVVVARSELYAVFFHASAEREHFTRWRSGPTERETGRR